MHRPGALEDIIHQRLVAEGLDKVTLPLGTPTPEPHVPVFATPNLRSKSRVVIFFGEPIQALGILAGRVANGPGGINKGSMVSVVRELQNQVSSTTDTSPPGIVIANPGELYWWPEGSRTLTVKNSASIPLPSLVHAGQRHVAELNGARGHETPEKHVKSVFETLRGMMADGTKINVLAVGQSCELITMFLDELENWRVWQDSLDAMLLLGSVYPVDGVQNEEFRKFLAKVVFSCAVELSSNRVPENSRLHPFTRASRYTACSSVRQRGRADHRAWVSVLLVF
jgi:hypothetical protein